MSMALRIASAAPGWLVDAAFQLAARAVPALRARSTLLMCAQLAAPPQMPAPSPYVLEQLPTDTVAPGWVETLGSAGITVTADTWNSDFGKHPGARVVAVKHEGVIVGTAGLKPLADAGAAGLLTWVGIRKEHQGRGLAKPLINACLNAAHVSGMRTVFLLTEDHRTAAIHTYLTAGFRPCLNWWDWTHLPRWRSISRALKSSIVPCQASEHGALIRRSWS